MIISVTQLDIDSARADDMDRNCVALAIRRVKPRTKVVRVMPYIGIIKIGKRRYDMSDYTANRLICHMAGHKIEPFEFEL